MQSPKAPCTDPRRHKGTLRISIHIATPNLFRTMSTGLCSPQSQTRAGGVSLRSALPCHPVSDNIAAGRPQVKNFDVRFIMKADDDAFVNVPALVRELKGACLSIGCRRERIYFGREIRNNIVSLSSPISYPPPRPPPRSVRCQCTAASCHLEASAIKFPHHTPS